MQTVSAFCESQEIKDVDNFMYLCFKQGFDIKRYGLLGKTLNDSEKDLKTSSIEEKQVIKEVIVEKRVEIPVEVIDTVFTIKEEIKVEKQKYIPWWYRFLLMLTSLMLLYSVISYVRLAWHLEKD